MHMHTMRQAGVNMILARSERRTRGAATRPRALLVAPTVATSLEAVLVPTTVVLVVLLLATTVVAATAYSGRGWRVLRRSCSGGSTSTVATRTTNK